MLASRMTCARPRPACGLQRGPASAERHRLAPRRCPVQPRAAASSAAANQPAQVATLLTACETKGVPAEEVSAAMQELEAQHAKAPLVQGFPEALAGTWRLVFATPGPPLIKSWQYIPVKEDVEIDLAAGTIQMVGKLGPLCNRFQGRCRFEAEPATGAYNMVFGWDTLETTFFSFKSIKEFPKKERIYSFFLLQGDVAVANSSATGGKTLMWRPRD